MSLTIGTIALFTGLAALLWTAIERYILKDNTWLVSFLKNWVGMFFIFSAVVKLVDPVGFSIKISDYFTVFHTEFMKPMALAISFVVLVLEFVIGVALLFNAWKKITLFLLLVLILFFTLLTGVSAIFNVVRDCGCFGDFLKISPWTSFYKDIVLLLVTLFILWKNKQLKGWFSPTFRAAIIVVSIIAAFAFTLHNYFHLPIWDFRAYKVGTYIPDGMKEIKPAVYENKLTYKHNETGEVKVFVNSFPENESEWDFVSNERTQIDAGIPAPIHDFSFTTFSGEDLTEQVLSFEKPIALITIIDVPKAKAKGIDAFRSIIEYSKQHDVYNYAFLTAATEQQMVDYKETYHLEGTSLSIDGTVLKTMIRSNPGLILLQEGTITGKWHYRDIPKPEDLLP